MDLIGIRIVFVFQPHAQMATDISRLYKANVWGHSLAFLLGFAEKHVTETVQLRTECVLGTLGVGQLDTVLFDSQSIALWRIIDRQKAPSRSYQ